MALYEKFETVHYLGGPLDGAREYVLGGTRQWEGQQIPLLRGRVLVHVGDDPVEGWEARLQDESGR